MDVQVGHRLPGTHAAGVEQVHAGATAAGHTVLCYPLDGLHEMGQRLFIAVQKAFHVLFGDRDHMTVHVPRNVQKDFGFPVLINCPAGQLPARDSAEHAFH